MRKIFVWCIFSLFLLSGVPAFAAVEFPAYTGYVNDYANVLDSTTKAKLEAACKELEQKSSAEMAIAIVSTAEPLTPKEYATELLSKWGVGKKGKNNGVLILLAMEERRVEIEVGYGLEGILTDGFCGRVLDNYVIPYFKQGNFGEGLYQGSLALGNKVLKGTDKLSYDATAPADTSAAASTTKDEDWPDWAYAILAIVLVVVVGGLIVFMVFLPSWWMAGGVGAIAGMITGFITDSGIEGAITYAVIFAITAIMMNLGGNSSGGSSGGGSGSFGGWSSGGSSGGGFGGFGGGSSGGGGAGRSW